MSSQPSAVLCSGGSGQHSCPGGARFCSWLCYSNVCSSSEIFLSKKSFSSLLGFWGDAACSSQVCHGEVTVLCEPLLSAGLRQAVPQAGLHRVVGKWQPLSYPQILLSFLFLLACLFIQPLSLSDWYLVRTHQSSPVHLILFSPFCSKKCQVLATRDSLVLPCCCMWIRAFVIDVFQHFLILFSTVHL